MKKIPLNHGYAACVDNRDYDFLSRFKWHAFVRRHAVYARTGLHVGKKKHNIYMHRLVMGRGIRQFDPCEIDHRNGNGLDNRRRNLRLVTHRQNMHNRKEHRSGHHLGTYYHKAAKKWVSQTTFNGKHHYLGLFDTAFAASRAYRKACRELAAA